MQPMDGFASGSSHEDDTRFNGHVIHSCKANCSVCMQQRVANNHIL